MSEETTAPIIPHVRTPPRKGVSLLLLCPRLTGREPGRRRALAASRVCAGGDPVRGGETIKSKVTERTRVRHGPKRRVFAGLVGQGFGSAAPSTPGQDRMRSHLRQLPPHTRSPRAPRAAPPAASEPAAVVWVSLAMGISHFRYTRAALQPINARSTPRRNRWAAGRGLLTLSRLALRRFSRSPEPHLAAALPHHLSEVALCA